MTNNATILSSDFQLYTIEGAIQMISTGLAAERSEDYKKIYTLYPASEYPYRTVTIGRLSGFGLTNVVPEGEEIPADTRRQGPTFTLEHRKRALRYTLTDEAQRFPMIPGSSISDAKIKLSNECLERAIEAHMESDERSHMGIINNGFSDAPYDYSSSTPEPLFYDAHAVDNNLTYSNLTQPADLSDTSLNDMIVQIKRTVDETGIYPAGLQPQMLIVPPELYKRALEIMGSTLNPYTANNAINALPSSFVNTTPMSSVYLTSPTSWYVLTNANRNGGGFVHYQALDLTAVQDSDPNTITDVYVLYQYYAMGVKDPRAIFGNEGQ